MTDIEYVTACYACAQGLYAECLDPKHTEDGTIIPCGIEREAARREAGGGALDPSQVTDEKSTGRKRAAMLTPIFEGMLCAWAGLRNAGGGIIPIVGCAGNRLHESKKRSDETGFYPGNRHHGPDKNTLNNAVGSNLHLICPVCHNRWHALNDPYYGERGEAKLQFIPSEPYFLHDDFTEATVEEQELVETWWTADREKRGEYPLTPEGLRKVAP